MRPEIGGEVVSRHDLDDPSENEVVGVRVVGTNAGAETGATWCSSSIRASSDVTGIERGRSPATVDSPLVWSSRSRIVIARVASGSANAKSGNTSTRCVSSESRPACTSCMTASAVIDFVSDPMTNSVSTP